MRTILEKCRSVRYLDGMDNTTQAPSILRLVLEYMKQGMTQNQAMHKAQQDLNAWARNNGHKVGR